MIKTIFRISALALATTLLWSCNKVTHSEEVDGARVETVERSCRKYGYCWTCSTGIGAAGCKFKWSRFCPGRETAVVQITPMLDHYEDGSTRLRNKVVTMEVLNACH